MSILLITAASSNCSECEEEVILRGVDQPTLRIPLSCSKPAQFFSSVRFFSVYMVSISSTETLSLEEESSEQEGNRQRWLLTFALAGSPQFEVTRFLFARGSLPEGSQPHQGSNP